MFVTNNTKDFCTGRQPSLLPALLEEIADVSPAAVAAVATRVTEVGARLDELEHRIAMEHRQRSRQSDQQHPRWLLRPCAFAKAEVRGSIPSAPLF